MKKFRFTLYVAGTSPRGERAIRNLRRLCEEDLRGDAEFSVVDILADRQAAEDRRILSTPTLDKEAPPPTRRVIGDLSDSSQLVAALALYLDMDTEHSEGGAR